METQGEKTRIKQFLLGAATDADTAEIGERIISDAEFDAQMSYAESELVEDFLDDALTAEEKELFYANFLTTPERVELLEETAALRIYAQNDVAKGAEKEPDEKKPVSFIEKLTGFLSLNLRPIAAVLVILVIGAIVWRVAFYNGNSFSPLEKDYTALNSRDLSNPSETANLSTKSLAPGTFRDTSGAGNLVAAALTEKVLFRLALPSETPKDAGFDLELTRGGQTVFKQSSLKVYENQSGQELKVILPKAVLTAGTYQIKLSNGATYGFTVE